MRTRPRWLAGVAVVGATMAACDGHGYGFLAPDACVVEDDGGPPPDPSVNGVSYRDLATHPGCSVEDLGYPGAVVPGYPCAAKEYPFPSGVVEDTGKPIVVLVHGNSDSPTAWERFPSDTGIDQLAELLPAAGFRTYAVDMRTDRVPLVESSSINPVRNFDHGWGTPLLESFLDALLRAHPGRRFAIVAHSLGVTITRDALRRLHFAGVVDPWARLDDVILAAGGNHGVSTCGLCDTIGYSMFGRVTCELGCLDCYRPTYFSGPLNGGLARAFETPCADGDSAFGQAGVCGGHRVRYTTIAAPDGADGMPHDELVSQDSVSLAGADNLLLANTDRDRSGYPNSIILEVHYGTIRSPAAHDLILQRLTD